MTNELQDFHNRSIDGDLQDCLRYNPQDSFTVKDIDHVLAVWEGENDGDDWRWIFVLKNGQYVFLQGGCDFTGWDCQSWATSVFAESAEQAAEFALGDIPLTGSSPADSGLGHLIGMFSGDYMANAEEVRNDLLWQLKNGKRKTWTEQKDEDFGLVKGKGND